MCNSPWIVYFNKLSSKLVHMYSFDFSRYFLIFRSWDYRNSNITSNRSHQYAMLMAIFCCDFFPDGFPSFLKRICGVNIWEIENGGSWTVGCMYKHPYLAWKAWYLEYTENFCPNVSLAWIKKSNGKHLPNCYITKFLEM